MTSQPQQRPQHGWQSGIVVVSHVTSTKLLCVDQLVLGWVTGWADIPPCYVTKPTRSTQPCILPWSLNWVPPLIGCGKGGNVICAGWKVTLYDPIRHVSSHSDKGCLHTALMLHLVTSLHFYFNSHTQTEQVPPKVIWEKHVTTPHGIHP